MRKGLFITAILILALALFLTFREKSSLSPQPSSFANGSLQSAKSDNKITSPQTASKSDTLTNGLLKLKPNPDVAPSNNFPEYASHDPEQLKEFYLPPLEAKLSFQSFQHNTQTPAETVTRSFKVSPSFSTDLANFLSLPPSEQPSLSTNQLLQKIGLAGTTDTSASYLAASSTLLVKDNPANLEILSDLLDEVVNATPLQFRTTSKLIASFSENLQSEAQLQVLFREVTQTKGADILTMPSILSEVGQSATVQMLQETDTDWTGVRFQAEVARFGFGHQQSIDFESREDGVTPQEKESAQFQITDVGPSDWSLTHTSQTSDGKNLYAVVSATLLDPSGKQYDPLVVKEP